MTNLCEKYRVKCFADIKGKEAEIEKIKRFIETFPEKKSLILYGTAGTGKTSIVYSLANEIKAEILELNASDLRNSEQISKIMGEASQQQSLYKTNKILLVDEVDGINKTDYGGLPELLRIISTSQFPIIITANDIWDKKFYELRSISEIIQMKELGYKIILEILKEINKKENFNLSEDILTSISIKSRGDVRAAINDIQTITLETKHENIDERDKEVSIFNTLKKIFKEMPDKETIYLYDKVNMPLDEIQLWIEENIPNEYKNEELYNAFESLSKADIFKGRIYRQQHWRFLVYQNILLSLGISAVKDKIKTGFTSYKKPSRILKIWLINQKNKYKKSISEKYAKYTHTNKRRAEKDFSLIKPILQDKEIQIKLRLDEKEIEFIRSI